MKKVFMTIAIVAALACAVSCGNNTKKAEGECKNCECCCKADSTIAVADSTVAAADTTIAEAVQAN